MAITEINRIDELTLNLTCSNRMQATAIESELYDFARNDLMESLDKVLMPLATEEDIVLDKLTIDLGTVPAQDPLKHILQKIPKELEHILRTQLLQKQCVPVGQILQESCGRMLSLQKSTILEKEINDQISEWCRNNSDSKFDPLRVAESVLKQVQLDNPKLDIRQIACNVFEKLKKLEKKAPAKQAIVQSTANDCGIVILFPYLQPLFEKAGCTKGGKFENEQKKAEAVSLLSYATFGRYAAPITEHSIIQLLCGFESNKEITDLPILSSEQKSLTDSLLEGVIHNWGALGHTSADGLRTTFLIRSGALKKEDEQQQLTIGQKTFDILLDKLPWGYSTVKLPWMKSPLHVKWR